MAVEVGQVLRGTVVRILDYGALVRLDEGSTGLVHISEIDNTFVRDVNDYFQINDSVVVKVLAIGDRNRIELSTKQAKGQEVQEVQGGSEGGVAPAPAELAAARREARASFDQKMDQFLRDSSERLSDIKMNLDRKRGTKNTR
jgi:S1 RNA binding domain protein